MCQSRLQDMGADLRPYSGMRALMQEAYPVRPAVEWNADLQSAAHLLGRSERIKRQTKQNLCEPRRTIMQLTTPSERITRGKVFEVVAGKSLAKPTSDRKRQSARLAAKRAVSKGEARDCVCHLGT